MSSFLFDNQMIHDGKECTEMRNRTTVITNIYDFIPENLIVNSVFMIAFVMLFSGLRYKAETSSSSSERDGDDSQRRRRLPPEMYSNFYNYRRSYYISHHRRIAIPDESHYDAPKGVFGWIKFVFTVTDEQILQQCGIDAIHYLSYSRRLIIIMAICTALSMFVILPVNFFMGNHYESYEFGRTTMDNLSAQSNWLWVHVAVIILYAPIITYTLRGCSGNKAYSSPSEVRTIKLSHLNVKERSVKFIQDYFREFFPYVTVENVQLVYEYGRYLSHFRQYERIRSALMYLEANEEEANLRVRPKPCSKKVNALEYYRSQEQRIIEKLNEIRTELYENPVGMVFITLATVTEVKVLLETYQAKKKSKWKIDIAPETGDIIWKNIRLTTPQWYAMWFVVNSVLFVVILFLATPVITIGITINVMKSTPEEYEVPTFWTRLLPVLLLCIFSTLMPTIIELTDGFLRYYTQSNSHYWVMIKIFVYLMILVLFLPTLGFQSLEALMHSIFHRMPVHWHCIFRPNRGSFYVNFVMAEALLFNSMDLLRVFDLIVYSVKLLSMKCRAEVAYICYNMFGIFKFGKQYAWTTFMFTICIVYSVFSPLIMPAAMIYIGFKHIVDRHNLFFATIPSNMSKYNGGRIHVVVIKMTICSIVTLKLFMAMIFASVKDFTRATVMLGSLVVAVILYPMIVTRRPDPKISVTSNENTVPGNYFPYELTRNF